MPPVRPSPRIDKTVTAPLKARNDLAALRNEGAFGPHIGWRTEHDPIEFLEEKVRKERRGAAFGALVFQLVSQSVRVVEIAL